MIYCKNCNQKNCNDLEGDFGCFGLPNKTTLDALLARASELVCSDCTPPTIEVDSDCNDNSLSIRLVGKGSASKVSLELYKDGAIYKTYRFTELGTTTFKVPYGEYKLRAFDTYNFECSTGYVNYSHQCVSQGCVAPIVTVNTLLNPPTLGVNVLSMGEASSIQVTVFKDGKALQTKTVTSLDTLRFAASTGYYSVVIAGECINGQTYEEFKVRIVDNDCRIQVGSFNYDCSTNQINAIITGGSTQYEYSLDSNTWVSNTSLLHTSPNRFYGLYVRDKQNSSCFTYYVFNTLCSCQLNLEVSEIQCNVVECQLDFTFTDVQCTNTQICSIIGTIEI